MIKRYFRLGTSLIYDECSALPFSQSYELFCKQYPQARFAQVFESDGEPQENGSLIYNVPALPPKVNG